MVFAFYNVTCHQNYKVAKDLITQVANKQDIISKVPAIARGNSNIKFYYFNKRKIAFWLVQNIWNGKFGGHQSEYDRTY